MVQNIMASTSSPISFAFVYPLTSYSRITHASTIIIVVLVRESCLLFLDVVWMQSDSYLYCYSPYYRHDIEAIVFDRGLAFQRLCYMERLITCPMSYTVLLYFKRAGLSLYHFMLSYYIYSICALFQFNNLECARLYIRCRVTILIPLLNPLITLNNCYDVSDACI